MNDMTKLPHASSSGFSLGNAVTPSTSNAAASPRPSSNGLPRLWPNMTEDEIKAASAALKEATSRGRPSASIMSAIDAFLPLPGRCPLSTHCGH